MPVNYRTPAASELLPVAGVRLGVAEAGIRKPDRRDLAVLAFDTGTRVAGVFTANRFCAAPVQVCRRHLELGSDMRALVINTGVANAGTGEAGWQAAAATCAALGSLLAVDDRQVLPFSTGVILEPLPLDRLLAGLPACVADLRPDNWHAAAHAIMTTDTVAKAASRRIDVAGRTLTITGISKGAGMIRPNMATMLAFIATDAGIATPLLQELLREGESRNTQASYRSALRYWAAWFALRYGQRIVLPVPAPAVLQFVVDHAERTTDKGLKHELPAAIDRALVAGGYKGKTGALALSTLEHRISVLSKTHQLRELANPCQTPQVRELMAMTRRAYAKRGVTVRKKDALTRDPLMAVLATCDESLRGLRDRAILLFAWSTGGRRRSSASTPTRCWRSGSASRPAAARRCGHAR